MRPLIISDDKEFAKRYRYAMGFIILVFVVLAGRLVQLQIVYGKEYRQLAKSNFLQKKLIPASRGRIYDSKGEVLAKNRPAFNVYIIPMYFKKENYDFLVKLLKLPEFEAQRIRRRILDARGRKRTYSLLAIRDVPKSWMMLIESNREFLPGVEIRTGEKRLYPQGPLASHLIGFIGEISSAQLESRRDRGYREGDWIGKFGVESLVEDELRGRRGYMWRVLDARGRPRFDRIAGRWLPRPWARDPEPGHDVYLTIDVNIQRALEEAMSGYDAGAAVVVDVKTGRILAYTSRPPFDPNELSGKLSPARAVELYSSPLHPMLDKVVQGTYFPGSTYKVVTATAALEEHLVDLDEFYTCNGWYKYGRHSSFRCSHAHGPMNLHSAIVASCNVFFFMLSERVGMDRMARYARLMGLGVPTGLGLNHEKGGFIPTKQWYAQRYQEGFRIGHTLNAGIGQGNVKVTVLQLAMLYSAIANGGFLYQPQVVERIVTHDGITVKQFEPILRRRLPFRPETFSVLQRALRGVVEEPKGTAYKAHIPGISVAGKTGTAQVRKMSAEAEERWRYRDHAWFAGYSPADDPQIAFAFLVEHGGFAAKAAVPVVMRFLKKYYAMHRQ